MHGAITGTHKLPQGRTFRDVEGFPALDSLNTSQVDAPILESQRRASQALIWRMIEEHVKGLRLPPVALVELLIPEALNDLEATPHNLWIAAVCQRSVFERTKQLRRAMTRMLDVKRDLRAKEAANRRPAGGRS